MTDRELLELAAKASGMEVNTNYTDRYFPEDCMPDAESPSLLVYGRGKWNPFVDDGDAFRLAVQLGLMLDIYTGEKVGPNGEYELNISDAWHIRPDGKGGGEASSEQHHNDAYSATRRAITRAAAEIGKTLP
ncbi:hypothetical protein JJD66_27840 [Pseudomonas sp. MF6751]|uniref:hypothetical protein n=1 Tax=Pseudomonas sp. MF6751 TaxID=2797528 RepID=UPI00190B2E7D|nr:hypothetical protein [Pseudomonas sp. MF6751]MBK3479897.1 hypothetical protein [Pseudomonas sp. MF6751]